MRDYTKIILGAVAGLMVSLIIALTNSVLESKESDKIRHENAIKKDYGRKMDSLFAVTRRENKALISTITTIRKRQRETGKENGQLTKLAIEIIEDTANFALKSHEIDSIYSILKYGE